MPKTAPQIVYGPTLNGEDLLWIFRKQKTQEKRRFVKVHDSFIVSLIDEALKPDALVWLNKARLAGAHLALTVRGASYPGAASTLIAWRPKIRKLLKGNRRANSITDEDRIINLRKNFHSGRATKDRIACLAYRYARKTINRFKSDPDTLERLAVWFILAIKL